MGEIANGKVWVAADTSGVWVQPLDDGEPTDSLPEALSTEEVSELIEELKRFQQKE